MRDMKQSDCLYDMTETSINYSTRVSHQCANMIKTFLNYYLEPDTRDVMHYLES